MIRPFTTVIRSEPFAPVTGVSFASATVTVAVTGVVAAIIAVSCAGVAATTFPAARRAKVVLAPIAKSEGEAIAFVAFTFTVFAFIFDNCAFVTVPAGVVVPVEGVASGWMPPEVRSVLLTCPVLVKLNGCGDDMC